MIKSIVKGMVIGVANIIPGVSGGTMAVVMGIYDHLIYAITHVFSDIKGSVKILFPIVVGIVLGIGGLSFAINWLFAYYPVQTNFFFIGLILGGLPLIFGKLKATGKPVTAMQVLLGVAFFALVVYMSMQGEVEGKQALLQSTPWAAIQLFGVGLVASGTMVIPGVSGSMVLMLMGYYYPILQAIEGGIRGLLEMDIPVIWSYVVLLFPFVFGILLGIGLVAQFIAWVLRDYPNFAYCCILGLIFASPLAILVLSRGIVYTIFGMGTGMVAFVGGNLIAYKLGD